MRRLAALAFAAGLVVLGATRAPAQPVREFTVGLTAANAADWPTFVGDELGFFKRYGLSPQLIYIGSVAATAQQMAAGSLDFGELSSTQLVEADQGGAAFKYFCNRVITPPYAIIAQKQYKKYADLKGRMIIIGGVNDITRIFTEKMLATGGVKPDDVSYTYAGGTNERYAALLSGSVAAAILFPPFDFHAVAEGYSNLGNLQDVMSGFPFVGFAASDKYAQAHPDVLIDFTKGYLRAVRWLNDPANKARAIDILIKKTNTNLDDAQKTYDELITRFKVFPSTGQSTPKTFDQVIDALAQLKILKAPLPPPTAFYDNRFVDQANAQLAREPK
jgi:NitT/TauT family transport system substrate-binding protein